MTVESAVVGAVEGVEEVVAAAVVAWLVIVDLPTVVGTVADVRLVFEKGVDGGGGDDGGGEESL